MSYDRSDYERDIETINNNGHWGTIYATEEARQSDVDAARSRVEAYESRSREDE